MRVEMSCPGATKKLLSDVLHGTVFRYNRGSHTYLRVNDGLVCLETNTHYNMNDRTILEDYREYPSARIVVVLEG